MKDLSVARDRCNVEGQMDSILLIGQSNMCGRGIIGSAPAIDPRGMMFMLRNGRWQPMSEPINPDRRIFVEKDTELRSGISLAASFAECYAETYERRVGLIPCAEGGSALSEWTPGDILFDHAVMQAKLAQRTSRICGILWHQGESETHDHERIAVYQERFFTMLDAMKAELGLGDDIPVILGEITTRLLHRWPLSCEVNAVLHQAAESRPYMGIASSEGLSISADGMHFDGPSYRVFGRRYFAEFDRVKKAIESAK